MKNIKRIFSIALTVVMLVTLSTAVFATLDKTEGFYTYELKVSPAKAKAGDNVTVELYLYDKNGDDITILKNASSSLTYKFTYPVELFNVVDEYDDITADMNYGLAEGDYTFSKSATIGSLAEQHALKKKNITISKDTYIAAYTFKVADDVKAGNYKITMESSAVQEATTAVAPLLKSATLTIEGAEATKYTVTFDTDGGSTIDSQQVEEGKFATVPAEPTKDGYTFKGWDKDIATTAITADTTFKALWERNAATAPTTGKISEAYEDAADYTNVWVGKYYAEPAADTKLTSFGVKYADKAEATFTKDMTGIEGDARIEFSVALIGVPAVDAITGTPFATADWK